MKHATVEHDNQTAPLMSCQMLLRWCAVLKLGDHLHNKAKQRRPKFQTNQSSVGSVTPKKVNRGVTQKCVNTIFGNVTFAELCAVAMSAQAVQNS